MFLPRLLFVYIITSVALLTGVFQALAQAPVKQWDKTYGGVEFEYFHTVQQTTDGGYVLGGSSDSGISGDKTQASQGGTDYWIVKLDATGAKQWDKRFGGTGSDALQQMQQTSDGGYFLAGSSTSSVSGDKSQASQGATDYWVIKLDANGNKQWDRAFGGSGIDYCFAAQQTNDGGYILGGYSASGISGDKSQASQGSNDVWIVKLNANGNKQWDKTFGGSDSDELNSLRQTADGGYILGCASSSGIGGDKTQARYGSAGADYWVIKLDTNGNKTWDQTFGGDEHDVLEAIAPTSDGGYIFGGWSNSGLSGNKGQISHGSYDMWIVKTDANGNKEWDNAFGGSDSDALFSLLQTADGGYVLGGSSASGIGGDKTQTSQGLSDYWIVKISSNGLIQWDATFGGTGLDGSFALQQTSDGGYVIGGSSQSGMNGDKTQGNVGPQDYWVIKTSSVGSLNTKPINPKQQLLIYPNPARRHLTLRSDGPLAGLRLSLLDATGRIVLQQLLAVTTDVKETTVQIAALPAGLYLVRLEGPNNYLATQHLIVQ